MSKVKCFLFTVKDKHDGKRYLMKLTGEPKDAKGFRESFDDNAEDLDLRTVRWLENYEEVSNYTGPPFVSQVCDSNDNPFFEETT
jgi:hypothetical protein